MTTDMTTPPTPGIQQRPRLTLEDSIKIMLDPATPVALVLGALKNASHIPWGRDEIVEITKVLCSLATEGDAILTREAQRFMVRHFLPRLPDRQGTDYVPEAVDTLACYWGTVVRPWDYLDDSGKKALTAFLVGVRYAPLLRIKYSANLPGAAGMSEMEASSIEACRRTLVRLGNLDRFVDHRALDMLPDLAREYAGLELGWPHWTELPVNPLGRDPAEHWYFREQAEALALIVQDGDLFAKDVYALEAWCLGELAKDRPAFGAGQILHLLLMGERVRKEILAAVA